MKPFNFEEAKAGKPVSTRDGRKVRIICTDVRGTNEPIVALVEEDGVEYVKEYFTNGRYFDQSEPDRQDLVMVPKKNVRDG